MLLNDKEYLPLSYLSQISYCPRRVGLLMNERIWLESVDTAKGRAEHENVHTQRVERRGGQVKLFEYTVFSDSLGVLGKCDLIEAQQDVSGCHIPPVDFPVLLYPVEFKHGKVRDEQSYNIQLCAQAICLEEMYHTSIPRGDIFYLSSHRRKTVELDADLRQQVRQAAQALRHIRDTLCVPGPKPSAKCSRCSLRDYCMPDVHQSAHEYCDQLKREAKEVDFL